MTAEKLAEQYDITREMCDQLALSSQQRWSRGEGEREGGREGGKEGGGGGP